MSFLKILEKVASVAVSVVTDAVSSGPVAISIKYMNMLNEHREKMTCDEKNMLDEAFRLYRKYESLNDRFKDDDYKYKQNKKLIDSKREIMNENIHKILVEYQKLSPEHYKELQEEHKNNHDLHHAIISSCTSNKVDSNIILLDSIKGFHKAIDEANGVISEKNKNLAELNELRNASKRPRDIAKQDFLNAAKNLKTFGNLYLKK
ncbi:hypothetical protein AL515_03520 [Citrobacter sp. FDAARGOS_156]|uniref:hypothetical protein n=1 Tax=Citrobacter sp. FDAARGOS_156 TaxID=1702170 RepID=UPI00076AF775|nr:hypothetical protein [Citrobacter sp. FDAARGOS_156]AMH12971.1 hypothetical protein AL515_03520 [Citrobacter sp. FDAARGOS_156]